jgi:hypothetical protein
MKKNLLVFILAPFLMVFQLPGCRDVTIPEIGTEELEVETESDMPFGDYESEGVREIPDGPIIEYIGGSRWLIHDNAVWENDFNGLITTINGIAVSDNMHYVNEESVSAVVVKFKIENEAGSLFTTFPDQAALVTSTGEQISRPNMWDSDQIGGEILPGEMKEGQVVWHLEAGNAEQIEWIRLEWNAYAGKRGDSRVERVTHQTEINLQ